MLNDKEVLHRTFSTKDLPNQNLPIALKEDFFDILYQIHSVQRGHCGVNKTDHQLKIRYYGIPRQVINQFIKLCPICNLKMTQITQPRLKPIRSERFWGRAQLDLVDMRHNPCTVNGRKYCWIAHVECHFTKFHVIWAQEHKTGE